MGKTTPDSIVDDVQCEFLVLVHGPGDKRLKEGGKGRKGKKGREREKKGKKMRKREEKGRKERKKEKKWWSGEKPRPRLYTPTCLRIMVNTCNCTINIFIVSSNVNLF